MVDIPTPSVPVNKVSDYELSHYRIKLYSKILAHPINYPLKPVGLWNVGLLDVGLSSIHCIWIRYYWQNNYKQKKYWTWMFCFSARALDLDLHCLEAMEYQILYTLCREGNYTEVSLRLHCFVSFVTHICVVWILTFQIFCLILWVILLLIFSEDLVSKLQMFGL